MRGQALGLLGVPDRAQWCDDFGDACRPFGFSRPRILRMATEEFQAVNWLVTNRVYLDLLRAHPHSRLIVYEQLCHHPLGTTRAVFDTLGWPLAAHTRNFLERSTAPRRLPLARLFQSSHPYFSIYRDSRSSAMGWRSALPAAQQDRIMAVVRPWFPCDEYWPAERVSMFAPRNQKLVADHGSLAFQPRGAVEA
jgi:hypothetical protein